MEPLVILRTCESGLHQYPSSERRCRKCAIIATRRWMIANKDKTKANEDRHENTEKRKASKILWRQNHPWYRNHSTIKSKTIRNGHAPSWLTKSDWIEIEWAYQIAYEKSKENGNKYEVDHIIPYNGKIVSGLHVPSNLQIILATTNRKKHNKYAL